jgi:hypothetical protein
LGGIKEEGIGMRRCILEVGIVSKRKNVKKG